MSTSWKIQYIHDWGWCKIVGSLHHLMWHHICSLNWMGCSYCLQKHRIACMYSTTWNKVKKILQPSFYLKSNLLEVLLWKLLNNLCFGIMTEIWGECLVNEELCVIQQHILWSLLFLLGLWICYLGIKSVQTITLHYICDEGILCMCILDITGSKQSIKASTWLKI